MDNQKINLNEEDDDVIDLLDLFMELLSHWKIIILSTIIVAGMMFLYSYFLVTPQYESTSRLYVLSKSTSITSLADIQMGSNLTNDYMIVVTGRPVLEQVISNLELQENYKSLLAKVETNNPSNTRILEITVTDADPVRAKVIADEIAVVSAGFISEKMDQDPPSIIQYGYSDEDKVSPSIKKNTIIGGVIGAVIAIVVIVILYLLNDTVQSAEDVEKKLGLTLLGSLPLERIKGEDSHSTAKKARGEKK